MNAAWLNLPLAVQLVVLAVAGMVAGAVVNDAIYRFAFFRRRAISPWMSRDPAAPPRSMSDRVPIWGWFGLARESSVHGRGFWVRPLLIEIGLPIALIAYYFYAVRGGGWLPAGGGWLPNAAGNGARGVPPALAMALLPAFWMHALLLALLTAATFIDFDERTIPDAVVLPGIGAGLVGASITPWVFPPAVIARTLLPTTFDSPWFDVFAAATRPLGPPGAVGPPGAAAANPSFWMGIGGWAVAMGILAGAAFALCDRRLTFRLIGRVGLSKAAGMAGRRLMTSRYTLLVAGMFVAAAVWTTAMFWIGGPTWCGCLSSVVGLGAGGGMLWLIRAVASSALSQMAMGFGDVTLMAMVGAMAGWQAALIAIFMAPFTSVLIVSIRWLITGEGETPFGPYLAAGTVLTLVFWDAVYASRFALQLRVLGDFLLILGVVLFVLMFVMLWAWRRIRPAR